MVKSYLHSGTVNYFCKSNVPRFRRFSVGNSPSEEGTCGWRVLKVFPNSPCTSANLVPYFDVLTHVNGLPLTKAESSLMEMIKDGVPTKLTVLNYVSKKSREATVVPNKSWGGDGLLGLMIRYDDYTNADEDTIHILDVYPGSPAEKAGLQPYSDYLLGTAKLSFKGYDQLDYFLDKFQGKEAQVFVFNAKTNRVREVTITPNSSWGGKGSLGCDVGTGYLHRLPVSAEKEVTIDGVSASAASPSAAASTSPSAAGPTPIVLQPAPLPVAQPVDGSAQAPPPYSATAHGDTQAQQAPAAVVQTISPKPAEPVAAPAAVAPLPSPVMASPVRSFVSFSSPPSSATSTAAPAMPAPVAARPLPVGLGATPAAVPAVAHTPSPPPTAVAASPLPLSTSGLTSGTFSYNPVGQLPSATRPPLVGGVGVSSGFLGAASQVAPASSYVPGQYAAAAQAQALSTPPRIGAIGSLGLPSSSPAPAAAPGLGAAYGVGFAGRAPYTPGAIAGAPALGSAYVPGSALSALSALSSPARPAIGGVGGVGLSAPVGAASLPYVAPSAVRPAGTS